jgi:hypothetical protein
MSNELPFYKKVCNLKRAHFFYLTKLKNEQRMIADKIFQRNKAVHRHLRAQLSASGFSGGEDG